MEHIPFISHYHVNHYLLQCLPSAATQKIIVKILGNKLEGAMMDGTRLNLGDFIVIIVPISHQYPKLITPYSFRSIGVRCL